MHMRMDLELVNFINSDLKWKEKGQRSMTRCLRKPGASNYRLGVQKVNTIQESAVLGTKKSGVAEKVVNAPIKKRRLVRQSPSPPPGTLPFNDEGVLPLPLPTISPQHEESGQRVVIKHASGQRYHSKSLSKSWEMKSNNGMMNSDMLKLAKKERFDLDDFSGIELLAAVACSCSISDGADHVKESAMVEQQTTPRGDPYVVAVEETAMSIESDGLSLQKDVVPVAQTLPDNGNDRGEKKHTLSKTLRLHWDLNTVMDEWEEPCDELLIDSHSHKTHSEGVRNDEVQNTKLNPEGNETGSSEIRENEERSMFNAVCANQLLLNSKSTVVAHNVVDRRIASTKFEALSAESYQDGKHVVAISAVPFIDEIVSTQCNNGDSLGKICESEEGRTSSREVVSIIICKTSDSESCASKSDVLNSLINPVKCEELSTSTSPVLRGQVTAKVESDMISELPAHCEPKSDGQLVSDEVVQGGCGSLKSYKSESENKHALDDPLSDCCGSNVTQEKQGHMAPDKVQGGYDSPFEDGELREEKGVEEKDCMYYESDNIYEDDLGLVEYPMLGKAEVSHEHGRIVDDGNLLLEKEVQEKNKMVGGRGFEAVPKDDIEHRAKEDNLKRSRVKLVESEYASGKFFSKKKKQYDESRYFKGNLSSIEGSAFFDVCKNDKTCIKRNRSGNMGEFNFRGLSGQRINSSLGAWDLSSSHEYRKPKHFIGDSAGGSSSSDINQSLRGLYKTYKSSSNEYPTTSKHFFGDSTVRLGRSTSFDINQSKTNDTRGLYKTYNSNKHEYPVPKPFIRDSFGSPAVGSSSFDTNQSMRGLYKTSGSTSFDINPSRNAVDLKGLCKTYKSDRGTPLIRGLSRDRFGFHQKALKRVSQEEFHYLERKVHGFSPNFNRGGSRSRPGSPIAWNFQKRRNMDTKRQSPDGGERYPSRQL